MLSFRSLRKYLVFNFTLILQLYASCLILVYMLIKQHSLEIFNKELECFHMFISSKQHMHR